MVLPLHFKCYLHYSNIQFLHLLCCIAFLTFHSINYLNYWLTFMKIWGFPNQLTKVLIVLMLYLIMSWKHVSLLSLMMNSSLWNLSLQLSSFLHLAFTIVLHASLKLYFTDDLMFHLKSFFLECFSPLNCFSQL